MELINVSVTGSFEIKVIREDGTIREIINQDNNTTFAYLLEHRYIYNNDNENTSIKNFGFNNSNTHISISGNTLDEGKELYTLNKIYATGESNNTLGPKLSAIYATINNLVGVLEFKERIGFTSSIYTTGYNRSFNTIAITTSLDSNVDHTRIGGSQTYSYPESSIKSTCMAYIVLGSPCTQASNEFLDITYRLQVLGNSEIIINDYLNGALSINGQSIQRKDWNVYSLTNTPDGNSPYSYYTGIANIYNYSYITYALSYYALNLQPDVDINFLSGAKKTKYSLTVPSNRLRGQIVRSLLIGKQKDDISSSYNFNNIHFNLDKLNFSSSKFQSIYSHNLNANTPYYDLNNLASGSIKPTLSGNWNKDIPEMYYLKAYTSGAIGISTYKYSIRKYLGSNNLDWSNTVIYTPFVHATLSPFKRLYPGYPGKTTLTNTDIEIQRLRYSQTKIVQADTEKVALIDVFNGNYKVWNTTTTPALPTTAIKQICVADNLIYVACKNTGLWLINTTNNTITNLNTLPCLSVDNGPNNVVAIFNDSGTLKLSTNTNFTSYNGGFNFPVSILANSSVDNFYYHKVDNNPNTSSVRIGIVCIKDSTTSLTLYWWDSGTGTLTLGGDLGGSFNLNTNPQSLASTNNGGWLIVKKENINIRYMYTAFFNSGILQYYGSPNNYGHNPVPLDDNSAILHGSGVFIPSINTSSPDGINIQSINLIEDGGVHPSLVYLGKGLVLTGNKIKSVLNNFITGSGNYADAYTNGRILNPYIWDSYYWNSSNSTWTLENATWNGSAWIQTQGDGKLTHTSIDALNSDVSITFEELGTAGLTATNYYTQIICNGVSLDQITKDFDFVYYWSNLPTERNEIGSSFTIPNSSPYMKLVPKSVYETGVTRDTTWAWLETEDVSKHDINITGYGTKANIITNPLITPGPNEILINGSNGNLIFNSADAGKQIVSTSKYQISNKHKIITNFTVPTPFAGVHRPVCLLRSDTGLTLNSGVETWVDQSGYGNDAKKLTGTKPTTGANNSITTVNFNTNNSYMDLPNLGYFSDGFSLFTYIKFTGNTSNYKTFFRSKGTGNEVGEFYFSINANNKIEFGLNNSGFTRFIGNTILTVNNWYLLSISSRPDFKYSSSSNGLILRINQVAETFNITGTYAGVGRGINNGLLPIKHYNTNNALGGDTIDSNNSFIGEMGFFSFYKNYLTVPEIQLVENGILSIFA